MTEPLAGIGVVDLSRVLAGPLVAMTLGDLGADVIKVESPLGDDTRRWKPPQDAQGRAVVPPRREPQQAVGRARPEGRARPRARAPALRARRRRRLELPARARCSGSASTTSASLRSIRASCTARSAASARVRALHLPGYDPLVQAVCGLMTVTGPPGTPSKTGVAIIDVVAALYATIAVLAALYARRDTGRGQRVTIDLLHANLALLANQSTGFLASGEVPARARQRPPEHRAVRDLPRGRRRADDLRRQRRAVPRGSSSALGLDAGRALRDERATASRTATRCAPRLEAALARADARTSGATRSPPPASRPGRCRRSARRSRSPARSGSARRRRDRRRAHGRVPRAPLGDARRRPPPAAGARRARGASSGAA